MPIWKYQFVKGAAKVLAETGLSATQIAAHRVRIARKLGNKIDGTATVIRKAAFEAFFDLSTAFGRHADIQRSCLSFNRNVAEALVVSDFELAKIVSPEHARRTYLLLRMQSHHVIEQSFFKKIPKKFQALADEVDRLELAPDRGYWRSERDMPAIPLPQELHGESTRTLTETMAMFELRTPDSLASFSLKQTFNFNDQLNRFVNEKWKSDSLEELFALHIEFYSKVMNFQRPIGKTGLTMRDYLEQRRSLARVIDQKLASPPP